MKLNHLLLAGGLAVLLGASATNVLAQEGGGRRGGGNFDPAQFQQRMMDRYKEQLEITDETEWKAIQPLVQKVSEARMASLSGRGMFGRGPRPGGDNQGDQNRRPSFGPPNPEAEALQKAIDSKASSADLKAALTKYLESRKVKQAELEKAQANLRKVLTPRQEAIATVAGLL
ncbi:MAG: hypothetical protein HZA90_26165 [Verrucomicrobia bacterium]|nr:hypothetical protein [Verrucomicrobiota bacterium]